MSLPNICYFGCVLTDSLKDIYKKSSQKCTIACKGADYLGLFYARDIFQRRAEKINKTINTILAIQYWTVVYEGRAATCKCIANFSSHVRTDS